MRIDWNSPRPWHSLNREEEDNQLGRTGLRSFRLLRRRSGLGGGLPAGRPGPGRRTLPLRGRLRPWCAAHLLNFLGASEPRPVPVPGTGETLTRREVEVLRLIAAGASNRTIVEQLVISLPTVKSHVAHFLRKLDGSSRTQAAARARDLGLT